MESKHQLELTLDELDEEIRRIESLQEQWLNSAEIRKMSGSVEAMLNINKLAEQRRRVRTLYQVEVLFYLDPDNFEAYTGRSKPWWSR
jgi:hypothetical protein